MHARHSRNTHAQLCLEGLVLPAEHKVHRADDTEWGFCRVYRVQLVRENDVPVSGRTTIRSPEDAASLFQQYLRDKDRECFAILMLNTKCGVIGIHTVSVGCLDASIVHPREVFKPAILASAASIIAAHNHPSGDPDPSPEDRTLTQRLAQSGALLGIEVLDHLVVGDAGSFRSLKQLGLM